MRIAVLDRPDLAVVPVKVTEDEHTAVSWASVENAAREGLTPIDEIISFGRMAAVQSDVGRIAQAFGVTEAHVRRRLALSGLPAPVLEALRTGGVSLNQASAMTVSDDPVAILAVLERCTTGWMNEHGIKSALKPASQAATGRKATFVGQTAYEAAGGTVSADLFAETVLFDDSGLLETLFVAKLEETAVELQKTDGWAWTATYAESSIWSGDGWFDRQKFARVYKVEGELSEEQTNRQAELLDLEDHTEAQEAELDALDAILEGDYTDAQKTHTGALVLVNYQGEIEVIAGLVKPEDAAAAIAAGVLDESKHNSGAGEAAQKSPYSQKFVDDMKAIHLASVQTALLKKPDLVLDLLAYALWENNGYYSDTLAISRNPHRNMPTVADGFTLDPVLGGELSEQQEEAKFALEDQIRDAEGSDFAAFRALGKKNRNAEITASIARCLKDPRGGLLDEVATETGASIRSIWIPSGENCFKRLKGAQLDALFMTLLDHAVDSAAASAFAKSKKGEKVTVLHGLFNDEAVQASHSVTPEQKIRINTWVPDCL